MDLYSRTNGNRRLCAIAFELLSRRGALFPSELITICHGPFDLIDVAALTRLCGRSPDARAFILRTLQAGNPKALPGLARSAACLVRDPEVFTLLLEGVFQSRNSLPRHCLADAAVCIAREAPQASMQIIERLLADAQAEVRWRATNALKKIKGAGHRIADALLTTASQDQSPLVRYEASTDASRQWNAPPQW